MEKRIKERYNQQILNQVMESFSIAADHIQLLDGFESFIYEFQREGLAYILRISHSLRRDEKLIRGEIDWINYLHRGGASVAKAIEAENGDLVVPVADANGGQFLATAFVKAQGEPPSKDLWNPSFYQKYGRLIGRMHALTRNYYPTNPFWVRPQWDNSEMLDIAGWLPESESIVLEKYWQLKSHLDSLPKSDESYGLIHQDAHAGNFFVDDDGEITLFDFDDCTYSWFINDIAIVLFYIVLGEEDQATFTREFMTNFLRGYRQENDFDAGWLKEIPSFLKLREIDLYAVIHRSFDVDNLDDPWVANFMRNRKKRIEEDVPFLNFDFSSLGTLG
jgi:Ser/Thr protein kinase RdoA (MazF antagonist)